MSTCRRRRPACRASRPPRASCVVNVHDDGVTTTELATMADGKRVAHLDVLCGRRTVVVDGDDEVDRAAGHRQAVRQVDRLGDAQVGGGDDRRAARRRRGRRASGRASSSSDWAVLSSVAPWSPWSTAPVMSMRTGVAGARSPSAQLIVVPVIVHGVLTPPTTAVAVGEVTPAGSASVTVTERATDGPALVTATVHAAVVPGTIVGALLGLDDRHVGARRQRGDGVGRGVVARDRVGRGEAGHGRAVGHRRAGRRRVDRAGDRDHLGGGRRAVGDRHGAELAAHLTAR